MALAIDASTPNQAFSGNDPWTTPSFTPPVDSLLVVVCMADWFGGTPTISVSSTGLTFTSQKKSGALNAGVVEIFTCEVGANGGTARTVAGSTSLSSDDGGIKVFVLTGYRTGNPVDTTAGAANVDVNNINAAITTGLDGCWVMGGFVDWDATGVPTSTDVIQGNDNANLSVGSVRKSAATATAGATTLNFNASGTASHFGSWAAISIAPAATGTTHNINQTDSVGVTDALTKTVTKIITESTGITDSLVKNSTKVFSESVNVTDSMGKQYLKDFADFLESTDSVVTTKASIITPSENMNISDIFTETQTKGPTDNVNLADTFAETQSKSKSDNVGITDAVAVTQGQGNTDSMGVSDSFIISLFKAIPGLQETFNVVTTFAKSVIKGFSDPVNISETTSIGIEGAPPPVGGPMSLVDEKRAVIGAQLGLSDTALAALSTDDLLHMYWGSDFPALHAYDGSESGLSLSANSTMDHFAAVERNENSGDKHYIRDVV